jgi:aryl sulfotransferase
MRYQSDEEDSARWDGFPFRNGDIVISTRSKSGTTWAQMICALLIFQSPRLPAPLATLSPWLDWLLIPRADVVAGLEAQSHRRFIKTHTPLDGIPSDSRATYLVVARHPLDMAVSLFHQGANLNRARIAELLNQSEPAAERRQPDLHTSLVKWINRETDPRADLDSLQGVLMHLTDAWQRRDDILLVHYSDLLRDLGGEMRRIADHLHIDVPEGRWPELVEAATFAAMRTKSGVLVPDPAGIMKDHDAFFRRGTSGAGRELLSDAEYTNYLVRAESLAPADMLTWLHR